MYDFLKFSNCNCNAEDIGLLILRVSDQSICGSLMVLNIRLSCVRCNSLDMSLVCRSNYFRPDKHLTVYLRLAWQLTHLTTWTCESVTQVMRSPRKTRMRENARNRTNPTIVDCTRIAPTHAERL